MPQREADRLSPMEQVQWMTVDPVRFSGGFLGHKLWPIQQQILRSTAQHPRTAAKACHASGKTFTAADAVLWWPLRWPDEGIVVTTAPTWTQVEKLLWGHVHRAAKGGRIAYPQLHKTELPFGPNNYALGLSTNEGVRFQGWHGKILIVLDEAPGVLPEIYEAIEGIRAGGDVHVLLLGQPMLLGGHYYDAFHANRARWETLTISAFDTPNLQGICLDTGEVRYGSADPAAPNLLTMSPADLARNPRPYLTTRAWVKEKWEEWGSTGSALWDVKVLGQFPSQSEDALIALAWLEAAKAKKSGHEREPLRAGVDVAGPGEAETVVSIRQGPNRLALKAFTHADARGPVVDYLRPYKDRLEQVNYDSIGQGHYFGLALKDAGFRVRGINVQETDGINKERFKDQKAAYYWTLRERAQEGNLGGIDDAAEQAQLLSVRYEHTARGQVVIVGKDKMREDGIPSPDRAEADMLAFAPDAPTAPPPRLGVGSRSFVSG
jgi:phage terminase large subunit